ncbi:MAG: methionine--tRNA ligase [Candidatus Omnitrophota bacterium]|nr:methionine--tRNA ligase [Candidatus Omnitrophota bacterium]MDZ4241821.1 methionine--tRNA ligase [Candidatus Omnitrophota bacterium]
MPKFYVTTPIYYVNDAPHIGHVYSTTMADILARYHRLQGEDVFFLTGTDEHAAKVVESAQQNGKTPMQWADRNAQAFKDTFRKLGITNDDFIRTTESRHKDKVQQYIAELQKSGDVYLGEYEGWYDAGQEEYIPDTKAKDYDYISPFNKKPLVRKKEKNYFFRLSAYQDRLKTLLEGGQVDGRKFSVLPAARSNEVLGRLNEGLNDVPISRTGAGGWGIPIPGDPEHAVYVWIDALINYLSTVDTDDRRKYWPADAHLIAKDILWFHAVIWPAMLLALKRPLPRVVYAHSFWISEGQKMSKSMGNFVDLQKIDSYVAAYGLDALRWFLAVGGPWGTMDSDFAEAKFIEVYNRDLANDFGNLLNRVSGLLGKYFDGTVPEPDKHTPDDQMILALGQGSLIKLVQQNIEELKVDEALDKTMSLVRMTNKYIEQQAPWKLAKTDLSRAGCVLYTATEALRLSAVLLQPVMPQKAQKVLEILGAEGSRLTWGELKPGTKLKPHDALFPRIENRK